MEALFVNTLACGDEVIGIDSGKFGERWCEMAEILGCRLHRVRVTWGQSLDLQLFEEQLSRRPNLQAVFTQATETSTGAMHPIGEISRILRKHHPEALLLVDGITAVGSYSLPMDELDIDGLVAGSQKAFMLPTGLSFFSFSPRAWRRIERNPTPRFYFDVRKEMQANQKGETFFSSNVTLVRALSVALDIILKEGLLAWHQKIQKRADFVRKLAPFFGLQPFPEVPSPSLSAFLTPGDSSVLRSQLESLHGITVMGGQDQLKGKILRIGHMGHIPAEAHRRLFEALQTLLQSQSNAAAVKAENWPQIQTLLAKESPD